MSTKEVIKKVCIIAIFIFIFNFLFSNLGNNIVFAESTVMSSEQIMQEEGGGEWLLPVHGLVLLIADAILELMQKTFIAQEGVTITATNHEFKKRNWKKLIWGIALCVVVVVAVVWTCGAATSAVGLTAGSLASVAGAVASVAKAVLVRWSCCYISWCGCSVFT